MKRQDTYYLIRAIIANFSAQTDKGIINALNDYQISKEASREIFKDEVKAKKPEYAVLRGFLILQNNFLRRHQQSAFYEVITVIEELRDCFKNDRRKTIRSLCSVVILRLFISLYFEIIFMPLNHDEDLEYVDKFKKIFSREDIVEIMNKNSISVRYIFESQGIDLGTMQEAGGRLKEIVDKFYDDKS